MLDPLWIALGTSAASLSATAWCAVAYYRLRSRGVPHVHQVPPAPPRVPVDLNTAIETVLVKAIDSQGNMMERMNRLNVENAQLAIDKLQQAGHRRGGAKRAAQARRTKRGVFAPECILCEDPMARDITPAQIIAHSEHRARRARRSQEEMRQARESNGGIQITETPDAVHARVDESLIQTAADGTEQIECADCGHAHYPGRHIGLTEKLPPWQ